MTLTDNLVAFIITMLMAAFVIMPLVAATIWLIPATKVPMACLALPLVMYTTKLLLDWNTREI